MQEPLTYSKIPLRVRGSCAPGHTPRPVSWRVSCCPRSKHLVEDAVDSRTVQGESAVDHQVLARHEPRQVRTEEDDYVGDVLGLTDASSRRTAFEPLNLVGEYLEHRCRHRGADHPR